MSDESRTPIRIDAGDLYSPQVNEFVEMQQALRRDTGPIDPQPLIIRIIYSSWFYLADRQRIGGLAGLGAAWSRSSKKSAIARRRVPAWPIFFSFQPLPAESACSSGPARDHVPQSCHGRFFAVSWGWA